MGLPQWAEQREGDEKFSARGNAVANGVLYSILNAVGHMAGALVSVVVLARLLTLEDFGVYNTILPFIMILIIISDGGTIYYTIRRPRIDHRIMSAAFWYASIVGVLLTLLMAAISLGLVWQREDPRLLMAGLAMAASLFFTAAASQHNALVMRCFRNDLRAYAVIGSVAASVVVGIVLALLGAGYWALIGVLLSRAIFMLLFLVLLTGWLPARPNLDRATVVEMMGLSNIELGLRLALAAVREADRLVILVLFSTLVVGSYGLAYMLAVTPLQQLLMPLFTVIMPFLAEHRDDRAEFRTIMRRTFSALIYLLISGGLFAAIFADDLLLAVLGEDKIAAAEFFPILIVSAVLTLLGAFFVLPFQATDKPDIARRYALWSIGVLAIALAIAIPFDTPIAIAWAALINASIFFVWRFIAVSRAYGESLGAELRAISPYLVSALAIPLIVWALMAISGAGGASAGWWLFGVDLRAVWAARRATPVAGQ